MATTFVYSTMQHLQQLQSLPAVLCSATWTRRLAALAQLKGFKGADAINMIDMSAAQPSYALRAMPLQCTKADGTFSAASLQS